MHHGQTYSFISDNTPYVVSEYCPKYSQVFQHFKVLLSADTLGRHQKDLAPATVYIGTHKGVVFNPPVSGCGKGTPASSMDSTPSNVTAGIRMFDYTRSTFKSVSAGFSSAPTTARPHGAARQKGSRSIPPVGRCEMDSPEAERGAWPLHTPRVLGPH